MIEEIDHQRAVRAQADIGALVNVADVDQDRISILASPSPDLSNAAREPAEIGVSLVIAGGQNVPVQIGRVQDRDANGIGIECRNRTRQIWDRADQPSSASEPQKIASRPEFIRIKHCRNFRVLAC